MTSRCLGAKTGRVCIVFVDCGDSFVNFSRVDSFGLNLGLGSTEPGGEVCSLYCGEHAPSYWAYVPSPRGRASIHHTLIA